MKRHFISIKQAITGSILDIGGGGEGVIGKIYKSAVYAIDKYQEELDEVRCALEPLGVKLSRMDAAKLEFETAVFDNVICFYSLMFMGSRERQAVLSEAARVLVRGGGLWIWDACIPADALQPFCVDLDIEAEGELIRTTYGIVGDDIALDSEEIVKCAQDAGLTLTESSVLKEHFYLRFIKL